MTFSFELIGEDKRARAGVIHTSHGEILTPVFAPVGTQATVKSLTPQQLEELSASVILANTYHLYLRPGAKLIAEMGGLHQFMHWSRPILTDSGGFQVFSLAENRTINDEGVTFKSHIDGSIHHLTPEAIIDIQEKLGADIIMPLDVCSPPYERTYNEEAMQRTHKWAERCRQAQQRSDQALFGIVQGGIFPDLRQASAEYISSLELPGNAIGGLSVGETKGEMYQILELVDGILPQAKPRYLMGVGSPEDLLNGVLRGIDMFDCVLPTRLARHNAAMTLTDRLNMVNPIYAQDPKPISEDCACYTCQRFSRAYVRHLILAKEMLAATLLSIHNLHTIIHLMWQIRAAILELRLDVFAEEFFKKRKQS